MSAMGGGEVEVVMVLLMQGLGDQLHRLCLRLRIPLSASTATSGVLREGDSSTCKSPPKRARIGYDSPTVQPESSSDSSSSSSSSSSDTTDDDGDSHMLAGLLDLLCFHSRIPDAEELRGKGASNCDDTGSAEPCGSNSVSSLDSVEGSLKATPALCEVYSRPRVEPHCRDQGFQQGWSLDLTTTDESGVPWDFDRTECRQKARHLVEKQRPLMLVGSPMCTYFRALKNLFGPKMDPDRLRRELARARNHLAFMFELYQIQAESGRYYFHEHLAGASSWQERFVVEFIAKYSDSILVTSPMCAFGMRAKTWSGDPEQMAYKLTRWMTNCPEVAAQLDRKCSGDHSHTQLLANRAGPAQIYPPRLCRAIAIGLRRQLQNDHRQAEQKKPADFSLCIEAGPQTAHGCRQSGDPNHLEILNVEASETDWSQWTAEDDVKGGWLPPDLVYDARLKELKILMDRKVYRYSTITDALRKIGKRPRRLKWIDTDKGGESNRMVRSRLVCTEVRPRGKEAIFAAAPPLESLRLLVSYLSSECPNGQDDPLKVALVDVSRAHFYAPAVRDVFIQLPEEDPESKVPGRCGQLCRTMYGTLDAAEQWGIHYSKTLVSAGFRQGSASPCHFFHPELKVGILVHGDDVVIIGRRQGREHAIKALGDAYEIKIDSAGPEDTDAKEIKILGRVLTYHSWGISLEADPSLIETGVAKMGLEDTHGARSPGASEESKDTAVAIKQRRLEADPSKYLESLDPEEVEDELGPDSKSRYQSVAALVNYLAQDRPDTQFCSKECMRQMSSPRVCDESKLKRILRYLKTAPRMVASYP